jgi:hypothetical protein
MERKLPSLKEQLHGIWPREEGAGQHDSGKINKLESKCATQLERIRLREQINSTKSFVCAGVVRVGNEGEYGLNVREMKKVKKHLLRLNQRSEQDAKRYLLIALEQGLRSAQVAVARCRLMP